MNPEDRLRAIEYNLIKALQPETLTVEDDSAAHVGHTGAASGAGHFTVKIISSSFEGKSLIERHRLVYDAVNELLETDIHALRIDAKTPAEAS
ncbi:MAG: BolA family transcriptional regulator [Coxiellaceae bacterium]|nr:BolA family transcriptional regulator [Coxiellaceae bacterium]